MKKNILNENGVSIIEMLIALLMVGVVTTSIFKLYITQHESYLVQDDITNIQQNARASIDELSRQIRMAGYDLPLGIQAIYAQDTNPDTITLVYHSSGCDTYLSSPMPQPSAELKCGSDVSCFYDGQWVFIYDADSAKGEWFEITHVQSAAQHLQHNTMSLSRKYDANALILAMTNVKFYIDNITEPDHPKMMVEIMGQPPQIYSDNIYDLQFQYVMKNGITVDIPLISENIREVKMNISARSNWPDVDDDGVESYRDRSFSTSVFLRNIGI